MTTTLTLLADTLTARLGLTEHRRNDRQRPTLIELAAPGVIVRLVISEAGHEVELFRADPFHRFARLTLHTGTPAGIAAETAAAFAKAGI